MKSSYHKIFKIAGEAIEDHNLLTSFIKAIVRKSNNDSLKRGNKLMNKELLFATDGDDIVRNTTTMRLSGRLVRIPRILNPLRKKQ